MKHVTIIVEPPDRYAMLKAIAKSAIVAIGVITLCALLAWFWVDIVGVPKPWSIVLLTTQGMILGAAAYTVGFLWITK
jgi:hypothetical protein